MLPYERIQMRSPPCPGPLAPLAGLAAAVRRVLPPVGEWAAS
jgi:hypothetical protein